MARNGNSGTFGNGRTGGRPKGVPNKVTTELKDMILQALSGAGGVEYLIQRAQDSPGPFLALVGKVLPLQVTGKDGKDLMPPGGVVFQIVQAPDSENKT
jgi:hypothetical protein